MASQENAKYLCTQGYIIFRMRVMNPRVHQKIDYVTSLNTDQLKAIICDKITAVRNSKLILRNLGHENLVPIAG